MPTVSYDGYTFASLPRSPWILTRPEVRSVSSAFAPSSIDAAKISEDIGALHTRRAAMTALSDSLTQPVLRWEARSAECHVPSQAPQRAHRC